MTDSFQDSESFDVKNSVDEKVRRNKKNDFKNSIGKENITLIHSSSNNKENSMETQNLGFGGGQKKLKQSTTHYIESESSYVKVDSNESQEQSRDFQENVHSQINSDSRMFSLNHKSDLNNNSSEQSKLAKNRNYNKTKINAGLVQNQVKDKMNQKILEIFGKSVDSFRNRSDLFLLVAKNSREFEREHLIRFFQFLEFEQLAFWYVFYSI
jgi:hypothetical protein